MQPKTVRQATGFTAVLRKAIDIQFRTITRDLIWVLRREMRNGDYVLDLGCGEAPYQKILDRYGGRSIGVDVPSGFGMSFKPGTIMYDGTRLPVRPRRIDWVLAIEVLEHVPNLESLLDELRLTLKEGGLLFITTPWSARVHYEPNDFLRPTPYLIDLLLRERGFELA